MGSLFFAINEPFGGFWRSRNKFSTARGNFPTNSNEREPLMCPLKVKASLNKVRPTHASASLIWYRQTFLAPHFKHHHIKHILLACWCWATQQNVMILLLHCAVVCVRNNTFLTLGGFLYKSLLRCRKVCSRQTFQVVVVESSKVGGEFSSPLHSKRSLENSHCNLISPLGQLLLHSICILHRNTFPTLYFEKQCRHNPDCVEWHYGFMASPTSWEYRNLFLKAIIWGTIMSIKSR